jgi:hypothetical protein
MYPFKFGTLIICIMIYFLKKIPLDDNVVWKENELVCKKIFLHFKNLERSDE